MDDVKRELIKAGDALAEAFGHAVAALDEGGDPFTDLELQFARMAILRWHTSRSIAAEVS